ncbi:MAG: hypothetical protein HRT45_14585 [Bdellovibrionales bacterium]|nr:hypothetical protein [Bdellovibrionales bacterium]
MDRRRFLSFCSGIWATMAGQQLAMASSAASLLPKKKVGLCVGVYKETYHWLKVAKSLGYKTVVIHDRDIASLDYADRLEGLIDVSYKMPFADQQAANRVCESEQVDFLIPHATCSYSLMMSMKLAEHFGFSGPQYTQGVRVVDKVKLHDFLIENTLPHFEFQYSESNVLEKVSDSQFPLFAKPGLGSGSIGAREIESRAGLEEFLSSRSKSVGYEKLASFDQYVFQPSDNTDQYAGVEIMVVNGTAHVVHVWDADWKGSGDSSYRFGPRMETTKTKASRFDFSPLQKLVTAVGLKDGAIFIEGFHNNGVFTSLFDVNLRPAGMRTASGYTAGLDSRYLQNQIQLAAGESFSIPSFGKGTNSVIRYEILGWNQDGVCESVKYPDLTTYNNIVFAELPMKAGDPICKEMRNSNDSFRAGYLVLVGSSHAQLDKALSRFYSETHLEVSSVNQQS